MAFEKTGQGMQALLAAKQATKSPLAEHMNFKSAFKQAKLLMMYKNIESERAAGAKFKTDTALQQQKIDADAPAAKLKAGEPQESGLKIKDLFSEFERTGRDFGAIRDSFARLDASGKDPSAAGDLALIFNYMKILDPNSVVRESEFANAAAAGALGERFIAVGKKIAAGQRLSNAMRKDFLDRGKRLYQAKQRQFKKDEIGFRRLAEENQIDPNAFMRDVGLVGETLDINNALKGL